MDRRTQRFGAQSRHPAAQLLAESLALTGIAPRTNIHREPPVLSTHRGSVLANSGALYKEKQATLIQRIPDINAGLPSETTDADYTRVNGLLMFIMFLEGEGVRKPVQLSWQSTCLVSKRSPVRLRVQAFFISSPHTILSLCILSRLIKNTVVTAINPINTIRIVNRQTILEYQLTN